MLRVSRGPRSSARFGIILAQDVEQIRALQLHRLVGFAFFIDQQREGDFALFSECAGVDAITEPNRGKCGSSLAEGRLVSAQLRDVLTAEDSTVVAQKHENRRLAKPERAKLEFAAVAVRQFDRRDAAVQGRVHGKHFGRGTPPVKTGSRS